MNPRLLIPLLIVALFAGCVDEDKAICDYSAVVYSPETQEVLNTFCNNTATKWTLTELSDAKPYYGIWCLEHTYIINETFSRDEILIGTIATRKPGRGGWLRANDYEAVELYGTYETCEGRL